MNWKATIITIIFLGFFWSTGLQAGSKRTVANLRDGKIVIFDASTPDWRKINNRTAAWVSGDLKPVGKIIEKNGKKWYELSYKGSKGLACSTIYPDYETAKLLEKDKKAAGIMLRINCTQSNYPIVEVLLQDCNETILSRKIALKEGTHNYIINTGFIRRKNKTSKIPVNWCKISYLRLAVRVAGNGNPLRFLLGQIILVQKDKAANIKAQNLKISDVRESLEVLPCKSKITVDGIINKMEWRDAAIINNFHYFKTGKACVNSPFHAKITYDKNNLFIATQSEFPTPPLANIKKNDGLVWQDEAIEFFFCPKNDNREVIQFTINAADYVLDYVKKCDPVTKQWKKDLSVNIAHERKAIYNNKLYESEIAFPLKSLNINPENSRLIGFQLAQNYVERGEKHLKTLSWTATPSFPSAQYYGLLALNQKAFGTGVIKVTNACKVPGKQAADFVFKYSLSKFARGNYKLKSFLISPDNKKTVENQSLKIGTKTFKNQLHFKDITNTNGQYSLFIVLENFKGNIKAITLNFKNSVKFGVQSGKHLLCPVPKKIQWKKGNFYADSASDLWIPSNSNARTKKTAQMFKQKYFAYTGKTLTVKKQDKAASSAGIKFSISKLIKLNNKEIKLKPEGYCLIVKADRISIVGADEPGLFYGCVTFFQLIKNSMKIQKGTPVPCVEILDWPDLKNRMAMLHIPAQLFPRPFGEDRSIDYLMEWVDRYVADLKYNIFYVDLSGMVKYKRRPEFLGPDKIYSLDDLRRLADFCRDRFISICPAWQCGGHANWWLLQIHPELCEKGYKDQADVTHPDHDKIVFDCMLDVIEAVQPKYISPKSDEWWHVTKRGEEPDNLLRGRTRAQAFLDWHLRLHKWLAPKGIKMIIHEDMLSPFHNGKRQDTYKIADKLPKDIIIGWWKGGFYLDEGAPWFIDKGFTIWGACTGFFTFNDKLKGNPQIQGFGQTVYAFRNRILGFYADEYKYLYGLYRAADYAWNMTVDNRETIKEQIENGYLPAISNIFSVKPNPQAGIKTTPINMEKSINCSFEKLLKEFLPEKYGKTKSGLKLPVGQVDIASIMTKFESGNKDCVLLQDNKQVAIPVNKKLSALIFLHTSLINTRPLKDKKVKIHYRDWLYGFPYGNYIVRYSDGTSQTLKLRNGENIANMDVFPFMRVTNDCRYNFNIYGKNGKSITLYQWEWANPFPKKKIKEIIVKGEGKLDPGIIRTVLFAVSRRNIKKIPEDK